MDHLVQNLQNAYLYIYTPGSEGSLSNYAMLMMDKSMSLNCKALISSASTVLEAKDASDLQRTPRTDAGLELFYNNLQLFHAACDHTQEFVESIRLRIGSECLVDEATGPLTAKSAKPGEEVSSNRAAIPSLSALRLEQMSKAVRWLVIDLQQGAAAGTPQHTGSLDSRPEDDSIA